MTRLVAIMAVCLMYVNAYAGDSKIDWSVKSGNSTDWDAIVRNLDGLVMLALVAAPTGPGAVTPATPGTLGAGVDVAAKKGESTKLTGKQWLAILAGAAVASKVVYHNRDKLGLGSSKSDSSGAASGSFNQSTTDNTRSCGDNRGATITLGEGARFTQDCHDSSSGP